jgi:hypothetical protein
LRPWPRPYRPQHLVVPHKYPIQRSPCTRRGKCPARCWPTSRRPIAGCSDVGPSEVALRNDGSMASSVSPRTALLYEHPPATQCRWSNINAERCQIPLVELEDHQIVAWPTPPDIVVKPELGSFLAHSGCVRTNVAIVKPPPSSVKSRFIGLVRAENLGTVIGR